MHSSDSSIQTLNVLSIREFSRYFMQFSSILVNQRVWIAIFVSSHTLHRSFLHLQWVNISIDRFTEPKTLRRRVWYGSMSSHVWNDNSCSCLLLLRLSGNEVADLVYKQRRQQTKAVKSLTNNCNYPRPRILPRKIVTDGRLYIHAHVTWTNRVQKPGTRFPLRTQLTCIG